MINTTTPQAYLIADVGTGNVRTAVVSTTGEILSLHREDVRYERDSDYPDSIAFDPKQLWQQIKGLVMRVLAEAGPVQITAITATSQREGIVVLDNEGSPIIGMSNHDNRGREWESMVAAKDLVCTLTGRFPTALFSA